MNKHDNEDVYLEVDNPEAIRKEILRLIDRLPGVEQAKYESFLMVQSIREEMMAVLQFENQDSDVIQKELETCKKKMEAAQQLIKWDETMVLLYEKLQPEERKNFDPRGAGLRLKKRGEKTQQLKEAIQKNQSNETTANVAEET